MNIASNFLFRTVIQIKPDSFRLNHQHRLMAFGSCFADRIGQKLAESKFSILVNPMGILYNPLSLSHLVQVLLGNCEISPLEWAEHSQLWHSFDLHSQFSSQDKMRLRSDVEKGVQHAANELMKSDILLLTWGTSWVYRKHSDGQWVANCHKYPAHLFEKKCLSVSEIVGQWKETLALLFEKRPNLHVILTVSPVRHVKDTLPHNALSKAILRVACEELVQLFPAIRYFPSYEIMVDDLRDYRFYEADLIHPSPTAIQYIWQHFQSTFMDLQTVELIQRWDHIARGLAHKPLHQQHPHYFTFLQQLLTKLESIQNDLPCEREIEWVKEKIALIS